MIVDHHDNRLTPDKAARNIVCANGYFIINAGSYAWETEVVPSRLTDNERKEIQRLVRKHADRLKRWIKAW